MACGEDHAPVRACTPFIHTHEPPPPLVRPAPHSLCASCASRHSVDRSSAPLTRPNAAGQAADRRLKSDASAHPTCLCCVFLEGGEER